jgi:hypothetical protein
MPRAMIPRDSISFPGSAWERTTARLCLAPECLARIKFLAVPFCPRLGMLPMRGILQRGRASRWLVPRQRSGLKKSARERSVKAAAYQRLKLAQLSCRPSAIVNREN